MFKIFYGVFEFLGGNPDEQENWGLSLSFNDREEAIREANMMSVRHNHRYKVMMVIYDEIHDAG